MISGSSSWVPRKGAVATDDPATAPFLFTHLRLMHVTQTSEKQSQTEQPEIHGTEQEIEPEIDPGAVRCSLLE